MKRLHPCAGCRYFYGSFEHNRCCNYIFETGKRRPCPPGAECTVKDIRSGNPQIWRRYRNMRSAPALLTKTCAYCGREFQTTYGSKLYCCARCQSAARNRRKWEARRARKQEQQG